MLAQSLSLALLAFLAIGLPLWSFTDLATALHGGSLATMAALVFGLWHQGALIVCQVRRERNRAVVHRFSPVLDSLPPPNSTETAPTAPLPPPDPARSVILNHGGKRERMTLMPTDSRLIYFLDACIALSAPDKTAFPSFSDLRRYGIPNNETDDMLTWLGDAVIRQERKITRIAHGRTLGDLRRMAAGG